MTDLDRRTMADAFWWGEVEADIREKKFVDSVFFKTKEDREEYMKLAEKIRQVSLYEHPLEDCSEDCKKRGVVG